MPLILAIDTSCDETSAAVTDGRRVLSNVISSQINIHNKYGGVYPALAKRAHEEWIDYVVSVALRRAGLCHPERGVKRQVEGSLYPEEKKGIPPRASLGRNDICVDSCPHSCGLALDAIAVTQGPGLAIALEVGIRKAKEMAVKLKLEDRSEKLDIDVGSKKFENKIISLHTSGSSFPLPISHFQLIAVNHLEGHIYSCFAETNRNNYLKWEDRSEKLDNDVGSKKFENKKITPHTSGSSFPLPISHFQFPALCLIVSGGHTQLVLMKDHGVYETVGQTLDDACGEALDKAAKILKLGYPGGPIIERLAEEYINKKCEIGNEKLEMKCEVGKEKSDNPKIAFPTSTSNFPSQTSHFKSTASEFHFNQPLKEKINLNFSYSGLKTQLLYLVNSLAENEFNKNLNNLAYCFQFACFEQIIRKTSQAIKIYQPKSLVCGGGVIANYSLRKLLRQLAKKHSLKIHFPPNKKLITDNAAMIGVAAYYHFLRDDFVENPESLEREPRLPL